MIELEQFYYRIMNISGLTIMKGNSQGKINVSRLKAGMYFIEIDNNTETVVKRFIKE